MSLSWLIRVVRMGAHDTPEKKQMQTLFSISPEIFSTAKQSNVRAAMPWARPTARIDPHAAPPARRFGRQ